ncbi:hypothetical protein [Streptomyces sp. TLI_185]|uniref:hypothetical protein n=1 Tax=Streptomyces sp. TLI_185 TaxID=2485151 RepID=UPI000F50EF63|nr:hypothetical protein [Streptomyces sp. TLI_185]
MIAEPASRAVLDQLRHVGDGLAQFLVRDAVTERHVPERLLEIVKDDPQPLVELDVGAGAVTGSSLNPAVVWVDGRSGWS